MSSRRQGATWPARIAKAQVNRRDIAGGLPVPDGQMIAHATPVRSGLGLASIAFLNGLPVDILAGATPTGAWPTQLPAHRTTQYPDTVSLDGLP